ncbi:MAG TPA: hypothetical protein VER12_02645 [Polyangiaceae bacterium]|nr:hypothetical protein [Polyangiaceae bacterium]
MPSPSLPIRAALLVALLGSACSSERDERRPVTSTPEDYCQRSCDKARACEAARNPAECRSSCQSAIATEPAIRPDLLGYVAGCIEGSDCASTSTLKCTSEAQAQLAASNYGQTFCEAYLAAGTKCDDGGTTYSATRCLEAAKTYDDGALRAANDCLARSCAESRACLAQAIPSVILLP